MKSRKRKLAWLLSVTMAVTSVNPGMLVTASDENEVTGQAVEEVSDPVTEEHDLTGDAEVGTLPEMNEDPLDEAAAGDDEEILLDKDEMTDILLEETETDLEEEIQIGEFENESTDPVLTEMDEVSVLSAEGEAENREEKDLPGDREIYWDDTFRIRDEYETYIDDEYGKTIFVKDITIENVAEDADSGNAADAVICEKELQDAGGWDIHAVRPGKVKITLTYLYNGIEKQHVMSVTVKGDRYTLETQFPTSGNNLFPNSEQEFPFVFSHEWRHSEEDFGNETVTNWALNFAPDENGNKYDTNLLKDVLLNNNTVIVKTGDKTGRTDILLKAVVTTESGQQEVPYELPVSVCAEYDVLYPESLDVAAGETLNLQDPDVGLRVEHVTDGEEPYNRSDVTYEVTYDRNQWENSAKYGELPILKRITSESTWLTITAYVYNEEDKEDQEICSREYLFDREEYSAYFEDLKEGDYSTWFFGDEDGELRLNTENLPDEDLTISWEAGYRKEEQNEEEDSFETEGIPESIIFWSETSDKNTLKINGARLRDVYKWLEETQGEEYWFEVRAHVIVNDTEVCMAQAGIHTRETREEYYFPVDSVMLQGWGDHINRWYDGWLENKEYPDGTEIQAEVTAVSVNKAEDETDSTPVCRIVNENNNGWDISAERTGTAMVTITYKDRNGQEQTYSYALYVSTEKYTLEPQWGPSEWNMLTNSTMEIEFVLQHQWIDEDGESDEEAVADWNLEFAPDENGWIYDTNLLKNVEINSDEKKVIITSGEETWGTNIHLKASIATENGIHKVVK